LGLPQWHVLICHVCAILPGLQPVCHSIGENKSGERACPLCCSLLLTCNKWVKA
jgi:hypothetical protein